MTPNTQKDAPRRPLASASVLNGLTEIVARRDAAPQGVGL